MEFLDITKIEKVMAFQEVEKLKNLIAFSGKTM